MLAALIVDHAARSSRSVIAEGIYTNNDKYTSTTNITASHLVGTSN